MALATDNIILLLEGIIDLIRNKGSIASESYDAPNGLLTLELSDSFDLAQKKFIEIDGQQYKIKTFTPASGPNLAQVVIKTSGVLGQTVFKEPYPYFFHGTYQMINDELATITEQNQKMPAILLMYNLEEDDIYDRSSAFTAIYRLQFAFLGESITGFDSTQHQEVMDTQNVMYKKFKEKLRENQYVADDQIGEAKKIHMPNFGVFISTKGQLNHLIALQATGFLVTMDLPIYCHFDDCEVQQLVFNNCAPGIIEDESGTFIQFLGEGQTFQTGGATALFEFGASNDDVIEISSAPANLAGTFNSHSLVNVATVTYEVDTGGGFQTETLPFSVATGNGLRVTITRSTPGVFSSVQLDT